MVRLHGEPSFSFFVVERFDTDDRIDNIVNSDKMNTHSPRHIIFFIYFFMEDLTRNMEDCKFDNNEKEEGDTMLTVKEISEKLQVSVNTIYRLIDTFELPAYRIGKRGAFRIAESDFNEFLLRYRTREETA